MRFRGPSERHVRALGAPLALALAVGPVSTAGAETIFERWGLRPHYKTEYKVLKSQRTWDQQMGLDRATPLVNVSTLLKVDTKSDEKRNNYEYGNNFFKLGLSRPSPIGSLSFQADVQRQFTETTQSLDSRANDNLALSDAVTLYALGKSRVTMAFGGGRVQQRQVKENRRAQASTSDRTVSTGWDGDAILDGTWVVPDETLKLSAKATWDGSRQMSSTVHTALSESAIQEATDRSRNNGVSTDVLWSRYKGLNLALRASLTDAVAQYYQASTASQETKRSQARSFNVVASGTTRNETLDYRAEITTRETVYAHAVEDRFDRLDGMNEVRLSTKYLPPLLTGSRIQGDLSLTNKRTERKTTPSYDTKSTKLELRFAQPLSEHFDLTLKGATYLDQDFYDDHSLDKDRLWTGTSAALRYKLERRLHVNAIYAAGRTDVVNIPRDKAAQNQVEKDYRVSADYRVFLPAGIEFNQDFQISAAYTYYTYNEANNSLTRMNRVISKAQIPLLSRTKIGIEHIFERSDTGAYTYGSGGGRNFNPGTERLRQDLRATLEYVLSSMITLGVVERYGVSSSQNLASGDVNRRANHEFSGKASLRRDLAEEMTLTATFERTESNQEDPYWRINARIEKQF